jgi:tRNA G26 N,N-dimethylase Trm1
MALKIVGGRPRMSFASDPVKVEHAKEAMARCHACGKMCFVTFPYYMTMLNRQQIIKAALDEHRKVCTAGPTDMHRTYEIVRPRA